MPMWRPTPSAGSFVGRVAHPPFWGNDRRRGPLRHGKKRDRRLKATPTTVIVQVAGWVVARWAGGRGGPPLRRGDTVGAADCIGRWADALQGGVYGGQECPRHGERNRHLKVAPKAVMVPVS